MRRQNRTAFTDYREENGVSLQGTFLLQLLIDTGLKSKAVILNKMFLGYSLTVRITFQSLHMSTLTRFLFYGFKIPSEFSQVALTITKIKVRWPIFSSEMPLLSPTYLDSDLLFQSWYYRYILNSNCHLSICVYIYIYIYIQDVPEGKDLTSGECSLGQTIPI